MVLSTDRPAAHDGEGQTELSLDGQAASEGGVFDAGDCIQPLAAIAGELRHAGCLLKRGPVSDISMVMTLWESKPGLTACKATKVRMSSAEPMSSTRARQHFADDEQRRGPFHDGMPVPERLLLSLSVEFRSVRETREGGE